MGLLDSLLGAAMGGGQNQAASTDPKAMLLQAALKMMQQPGAASNVAGAAGGLGALGGLGGLLGALQGQGGGLAEAAQSWIGNGANVPVSGDQLQAAAGSHIQELAQATGLSQGDTANNLAAILPDLINKLTPNGQLPAAGGLDLAGLLGGLLGDKKQA